MKNRKCPNHKACWDYGSCEDCELGKEITRLHKRIDRLKRQNETLTVKKNDWERLAKFYEANEPNKWISVNDRLPEKNGMYLIFSPYTNKEGGIVYCNRFLTKGNPIFPANSFESLSKVTHWMPLPEPPKESEDTE